MERVEGEGRGKEHCDCWKCAGLYVVAMRCDAMASFAPVALVVVPVAKSAGQRSQIVFEEYGYQMSDLLGVRGSGVYEAGSKVNYSYRKGRS